MNIVTVNVKKNLFWIFTKYFEKCSNAMEIVEILTKNVEKKKSNKIFR